MDVNKIAVEFTGSLANRVESLRIVDAFGNSIVAFSYSDSEPWPRSADGEGDSLQLFDTSADPGLSASWTTRTPSPGEENATSPPEDFNGDGLVNAADIDLLNQQIHAMSGESRFDLNSDRQVDPQDLDDLLATLGTTSGDTNLDGTVSDEDFTTLARNFGTAGFGWSSGDFDGDGQVSFNDFVRLSTNFDTKTLVQQ